jgi:hypothetical protein
MVNLKVLIFLLTWNIFQISAQIPDRNTIDYSVGTSMYDLISMETTVKQKLANFNLLVKICINNLKGSNMWKNFVSLFDKFSAKVFELQTMSDHAFTYFSLENFSDYKYSQIYISTLFSSSN